MQENIFATLRNSNISKAAVMVECMIYSHHLNIFFSRFRRAQSERPVPVSSRALHTANHGVPRLCSEHRRGTSQRSPQCAAVPQNHGWREVMSSAPAQTRSRHSILPWRISTPGKGSTFVMEFKWCKLPQILETNSRSFIFSHLLLTPVKILLPRHTCTWHFFHAYLYIYILEFPFHACLVSICSSVFPKHLKITKSLVQIINGAFAVTSY